jgi:hypothetical protein
MKIGAEQDSSGEFSAEQNLLRSVVALHEDRLLPQGQVFLSEYPLPYIHRTIRHLASCLALGDASQTVEKLVGVQQWLHLSVYVQNGTVKRASLALREQVDLDRSQFTFGVGFLAIMHHGVEELFGLISDPQRVQQPDIFVMRHPMLLNARHCQLWRGLRWVCANLLVWEDVTQGVLPMELD